MGSNRLHMTYVGHGHRYPMGLLLGFLKNDEFVCFGFFCKKLTDPTTISQPLLCASQFHNSLTLLTLLLWIRQLSLSVIMLGIARSPIVGVPRDC